MQTYIENRGSIQGKTVVWGGDGNNMCQSYMHAAMRLDFNLRTALPVGFEASTEIVELAGSPVTVTSDLKDAVKGAHLIATDVWASMGQEEEREERVRHFRPYQVTRELLDLADKDVLFMHCLPAHRGEEISHDLLDDPRSIVWEEAENRLHAQKALLEFLLCKKD